MIQWCDARWEMGMLNWWAQVDFSHKVLLFSHLPISPSPHLPISPSPHPYISISLHLFMFPSFILSSHIVSSVVLNKHHEDTGRENSVGAWIAKWSGEEYNTRGFLLLTLRYSFSSPLSPSLQVSLLLSCSHSLHHLPSCTDHKLGVIFVVPET